MSLMCCAFAKADYADLVNPFIGASTNTEAAGAYHGLGKTFPGATTPWGMAQVSPQTITGGDNGSGYSHEHKTIEGFSMTQMSGVGWFGELGNFMVMPTTGSLRIKAGDEAANTQGWRSRYDKKTEVARAGYYAVRLTDYNIKVEASATQHCGILRMTYPSNDNSRWQVDLARRVGGTSTEQQVEVLDDHTLRGWMRCTPQGGGWGHGEGNVSYTLYFYATSSKPLKKHGFWDGEKVVRGQKSMKGSKLGFFADFKTKANEQVELKVGISFVDQDGAKRNYDAEIANVGFDGVRAQAHEAWNKALGVIDVQGGTADERTVFYTALYHTMIDPRVYQDVDGRYVGGDLKVHRGDGSFTKRTVFSGWDVFRSQMPLQTIINPLVVNDMLQSLTTMATQSGRHYYERWELLNAYSGCMLGNPALSVLADAYAKGIRGYDINTAYQYAVKSSHLFGNDSLGYTPGGLGVSKTLEYAYGDWCLARLAQQTGRDLDYRNYSKKALAYRNLFDSGKGWFRPRNEDGSWMPWPEEGRLKEWYGCMECNLLQQGWFVPHDVEGMVSLMGGRDKVLADLTEMFEKTPKNMLWNDYYNHANEPVHFVPYLFNRLGQPWQTQRWTRFICKNAYRNSVEGMVGNEDVGQMSAWYVLSAAGIHQYCPGDTRFEITSPVFRRITFNLPEGKCFVIEAKGNSDRNVYIQHATLNGNEWNKCFLDYKDIMAGGTLSLQMGDKPNRDFGTAKEMVTRLSLNSDVANWQLKPQAEVADSGAAIANAGYKFSNGVKGVVPGTVFTAYVEAGLEETPEYGDNIQRVDERKYNRPYWYRTEFVLKNKPERGQKVWLCFDNTNRFADFYFNGHKISGTPTSKKDVSGHMLRSRFDVTDLVVTDRPNAVAVLIYDPDQKKTRNEKGPYGVACSPSYLAAAGWDWMPYVPGRLAGITGNAYVEVTGSAVMVDPWVRSQLPTLDEAEMSISSDIKNTSSEAKHVTLSGTIMPGNINFSKTCLIRGGQTGNIHIDKNDFKDLIIKNPRLWWPNGYGEPNLYQCKLQCSVDGEVTDTTTINFGIRKYDYRIETNAVNFPVLQLYVNGERILVKGGNWGMSEYMLRCHGKDYEPKIRLHKDLNYNMIRLWTGCVTDEEFYDYCDRMGIMVWDDFWLYVAFNDVVQHDAFKVNARDKVRRLRNHACIAVWCGANETHPVADLDQALRMIVMTEDGNDRLYTSCSNQDAKSGSGWWKDLPPRHHFETSASNLAFNKPSYPYGIDHGYGFRSEIGMPCFPQYESVKLFIPKDKLWPLPTDEELKTDSGNVYNQHFFGKEAWNADPVTYKRSVNDRYGEANGIEEFCEKAQLVNLEDMKGMYEAWNDKMWEDASALLIWMSHPAYPSFVWQTYDYYYDPTGCYWGAKKACEPRHVQWNCLTNSIKVINSTPQPLNAVATAEVYDINGKKLWSRSQKVKVEAANKQEAFVIGWQDIPGLTPLHFLRLSLADENGKPVSDNFYWRNGVKELDYTTLQSLPDTEIKAELVSRTDSAMQLKLKNVSSTVAFGLRLRMVDAKTGERVLPLLMNDNYQTLMPGEETTVTIEAVQKPLDGNYKLLVKPFAHEERLVMAVGKEKK